MFSSPDVGHLRTIFFNGYQLYCSKIDDFYPVQEMKEETLLTGGPRTIIYTIGKKKLQGSFSFPLYLNGDGVVSDACKEVIRCADNPMRNAKVSGNFAIMGEKKTANSYQGIYDTSAHKTLTIETGVITKATIDIKESGPITVSVTMECLFDEHNEDSWNVSPVITGAMSRSCTFADCIITTGKETLNFKDAVQGFSLTFENNVEPIFLLRPNSRDYANYLALGRTKIYGEWTEIKESEEFGHEKQNWKHGGYFQDENLQVYLRDMQGTIRDVLYEPIQQPLAVGVYRKKTVYKALWRYGWVDANNNLVFPTI